MLAALALGAVAIDYDGAPDRYFFYFTILTNVAIGVWFGLAAWMPPRADRWSLARLALTLYGLLTFGVYWALLAPNDHPSGLASVTNLGVHGVMPLAYTVATVARGDLTGWYPYFFLDEGRLGRAAVAAYIATLLVLFLGSAYLWRALVHRRHASAQASGHVGAVVAEGDQPG